MYTQTLQLCVRCSGSSGNLITSTGTTGGVSGGSSGGFAPDGPFSGDSNNGIPYNPNKTILINSNECDAYNASRAKANFYGIEVTGLILAGPNEPLYITLPPAGNTYQSSSTANQYLNVSWGEGFSETYTVIISLSTPSVTVNYTPSSSMGTYSVIGHFHTHPLTPGLTYGVSPDDQSFAASYPAIKHEIWDYNGIYEYWPNGTTSATHPCTP